MSPGWIIFTGCYLVDFFLVVLVLLRGLLLVDLLMEALLVELLVLALLLEELLPDLERFDLDPEPPFFPPPVCLLTVAQARRFASPSDVPLCSYPSSISFAIRFCLSVYLDLSPRAMTTSIRYESYFFGFIQS